MVRRVIALALLLGVSLGAAAPAKPSQYDIQAVYLYNFGKFVRWPAGASGPLRICVAGPRGFAAMVQKVVSGEQINGRELAVQTIAGPAEAAACSILFVDSSEKARAEAFVGGAGGKPILTVSDAPGFLEQGGMIQFLLIDSRVRFSVNLAAVQRAGLGLSSELLKVAVSVDGKPAGGQI